jgi:hypothetical protein
MSDNEDAAAPLWYSEVLSVKNAVGGPIPEFCQRTEEDTKGVSVVSRQHSGDVLPNQPPGAQAFSEFTILDGESAPIASKARSKSSDREVLTGRSADKKVNCSNVACLDFGEVPEVLYVGIVMREYRARKRLDLRHAGALPPER